MKVKFLIIRLSSIGDIVLTTPVIRLIKNNIENSEIHYLVKNEYVDTLKHNPYIDKIIPYTKQSEDDIIENLHKEGFDYIVDLHKNIRSLKIKKRLKTLSFTFDKLNIEKWLLVNFKIDKLPDIHIVDRYVSALKSFGIENDNYGLDYFITEKDTVNFDEYKIKEKFIAIAIGAQHFTKQIPEEILEKIISSVDAQFVLLGGKSDIDKSLKLEKHQNVVNLVSKISLNQSAYIIKKSQLIVTSDTGLMHIAAAFKKDIISLWGNTVPKFGMYPYKPGDGSKIFEVQNLKCRPCSKIGFRKCPKKHFKCMMNQDIGLIIKHINYLLDKN